MDGVTRCSRYSFGPNRLHYCGPDASSEILAYLQTGVADPALSALLAKFGTLYPYLRLIAEANGITDPFDDRVVSAYWLGNSFLEQVSRQKFYEHLLEVQEIKKREGAKAFSWLEKKIAQHALPHHSFHVLNIWKRTGHAERLQTLQTMDACRVSWGKVLSVAGPKITVRRRPLLYTKGRLQLAEERESFVTRELQASFEIEQLQPGVLISIHWDAPCEVISRSQARLLEKYTLQSVVFANQTI